MNKTKKAAALATLNDIIKPTIQTLEYLISSRVSYEKYFPECKSSIS